MKIKNVRETIFALFQGNELFCANTFSNNYTGSIAFSRVLSKKLILFFSCKNPAIFTQWLSFSSILNLKLDPEARVKGYQEIRQTYLERKNAYDRSRKCLSKLWRCS